ncbi:hypothetical protein AB0M46_48710, partial [Dactylosporangium sp. NPDC051485]|uniref:hypothetical protein n=1 Tax=Dactylosporangium sp. NPDC051485 TaxID=3154846 RepID=UPI003446F53E
VAAGGHSLLVAQLCVALSEELSVEVPYVLVATASLHRPHTGRPVGSAGTRLRCPHCTQATIREVMPSTTPCRPGAFPPGSPPPAHGVEA